LRKITVISSSMVFESTAVYPTPEGEERRCPPPRSTYGFQKLATEYFAQGAWEQYKLPYTICRPFNCIGVGEKRALVDKEVLSGNVKLAMSHVVPDLAQKVLKGQDPLHILGDGGQVRHYTYGGDLARGIRLAIESPAATDEDFNLSTAESTTVLELARMIWAKVRGDEPFRHVSDEPFTHDVQKRVPSVEKARRVLGFEATTSLSDALDEIIPWIGAQIEVGGI
jgi:nucleoside-diphosphate-sugar epimerase